jgi:hypothetical protein
MAEAIPHRRTDRRRFGPEPVETALLDALAETAGQHRTHVHPASGAARTRLIEIISESAALQLQQPGYAAENAKWSSRYAASADGIQPGNAVAGPGAERRGDIPMRPSPHALLGQPPHGLDDDDASALIVLSTDGDDHLARLRAGEAASAVLLTATNQGIATTPLSQPLEITETRNSISAHFAGHGQFAQLVIRLGRPQPGTQDLAPSSRRALRFVLDLSESR